MTTKNIIDILIEERAPNLSQSLFWPILRPILNFLLGYRNAVRMARFMADKSGYQSIEYLSKLLRLNCEFDGFEKLPQNGAVIVIANHPSGIADGIALFDVLAKFRKDLVFYANADAMRICPQFDDAIIPIEWKLANRSHEKARQTLLKTKEILEKNMTLGIFPAGRLSRITDGRLQDPEWASSFVSIAKKYKIPILPVSIEGPNAFWFHNFGKISQELRDITLFHELLNKKGKSYRLHAGDLIMPDELDNDVAIATQKLKFQIENHFN